MTRVVLVLFALTAVAHADPPPARRGPILIGFSVGGGGFGEACDLCEAYAGAASDAHVGYTPTPRLALAVEISGIVHTRKDKNLLVFATLDAIARVWLTPNLWFEAGGGFGRQAFSDADGYPYVRSDAALSLTGAAGVDLYTSPELAIDVELRSSTLVFDEPAWDVALSFGFSWWFRPDLQAAPPPPR